MDQVIKRDFFNKRIFNRPTNHYYKNVVKKCIFFHNNLSPKIIYIIHNLHLDELTFIFHYKIFVY